MIPAIADFRRGPALRAIIAPWLKPMSARLRSPRPSLASSASRNAFSAGVACCTPGQMRSRSASDSGNHCRPIGASAQGSGACGEAKAVAGHDRRQSAADVDEVVAVGAIAVQEHDQARPPAGRSPARDADRREGSYRHRRLLPDGAVVGPEQRRGDAAPWRPAFGDRGNRGDRDRRLEAEGIGDRIAEREVAGRENVGVTDAEEEVDVGRPRADALDQRSAGHGPPRPGPRRARRGRARRARPPRRRAES